MNHPSGKYVKTRLWGDAILEKQGIDQRIRWEMGNFLSPYLKSPNIKIRDLENHPEPPWKILWVLSCYLGISFLPSIFLGIPLTVWIQFFHINVLFLSPDISSPIQTSSIIMDFSFFLLSARAVTMKIQKGATVHFCGTIMPVYYAWIWINIVFPENISTSKGSKYESQLPARIKH